MALLELVFGDIKRAKIGLVTLDASVEEIHRKTNVVTDHPVEEGVNIVDHIRHLPDEITISGVVTDTPLYILPSLFAPNPVDNRATTQDRAGQGYDELERIMNDGELVEVITTLRQYDSMHPTSFEVTRNAQTGNVIDFRMALRQVKTAVAEELSVPDPADPSNGNTADNGKQPTSPANDSQAGNAENRSLLFDAFDLTKFPAVGG